MDKYQFVNIGGIHWEWLLCYEEAEGGVRVVFYERWHKCCVRPAWVDRCFALAYEQAERRASSGTYTHLAEIWEESGRIAVALRFSDYDVKDDRGTRVFDNRRLRFVPIINPDYIFHYRDLEEVELYINSL